VTAAALLCASKFALLQGELRAALVIQRDALEITTIELEQTQARVAQ
jgi:hypothetical protein